MVPDYRREKKETRSDGFSAVIAAGLATLGLIITAVVATSTVQHGLAVIGPGNMSPLVWTIVETVPFQVSILLVGLVYLWMNPPLKIEIRRPTATGRTLCIYGLLASFVVWFLAFAPTGLILPMIDFFPWYPVTGYSGVLFSNSTLILLVVLSLFVIGPIEEFFFRGVVQGRLRSTVRPSVAIGVASFVFAFFHVYTAILPFLSPLPVDSSPLMVGYDLLYYTAMGIILGVIYERTDNLTVPILVHGLFNAILFLLFLGPL